MKNADKKFCKRGHPLTPENVYLTRIGGRSCRVCAREYQKRRRQNDLSGYLHLIEARPSNL